MTVYSGYLSLKAGSFPASPEIDCHRRQVKSFSHKCKSRLGKDLERKQLVVLISFHIACKLGASTTFKIKT
jgi:hypothetical protein